MLRAGLRHDGREEPVLSAPSIARAYPPTAPEPAPAASPRSGRAGVAAALSVLVVLAAFFAPALLGSGDFVYRDAGRMHAPMKRWIGEEIRAGRLPEWNPYSGLGTPVLANGFDAVMHPFTALTVILSPGAAMKAWVLLSFALAAAGAFAWARVLSGSHAAAAVTAIAFALSGPLVSSSDNVQYLTAYAALPWVLAAGQLNARRGGAGGAALVGGASFLCAAAGDPQAWAISVAMAPVFAVAFAARGERVAALRRGVVGALVAVIAAAPVIAPIAAWLPWSQRARGLSGEALFAWNLHPGRLLELVVPELFRGPPEDPISSPVFRALAPDEPTAIPWFVSIYVGASVVALAAVAAARDRRARVLGAVVVACTWAALGHHAGFQRAVAHVPFLGQFRYWEKMTSWVALLTAAAAGRGFDLVLEGRAPRGLSRSLAVCAAAALGCAAFAAAAPERLAGLVGAPPTVAAAFGAGVTRGATHCGLVLALLAGALVAFQLGRLGRSAAVALGAVVVLDLFGGNAGAYVLGPPQRQDAPPLAAAALGGRVANAFSVREDRWPELGHVGSTWEWTRRTLGPTFNVPLRVTEAEDYVGLREARWAELRRGEGHADRLGLFGFDLLLVPGTPALAAKAGVSPPHRVVASDPELPAFLVAMDHRPRAYVAERVERVSAEAAFAFARTGGRPGVTVVEAPLPADATRASGDARVVRDLPGETEIEARANARALLVLNDLFAPGWTATVDDAPGPIVRANWVARGVWVEAGTHRVRFRYRTPGLRVGALAALAGAAGLGVWGGLTAHARRRRSATPPPPPAPDPTA
jgi:hypothetical protein